MQHFGAASAKRTCCWSTSWSLLCGLVSRLQYSCECHAPTETKLVPCEDVYYACMRIIDIRFINVYMYMCMHMYIYTYHAESDTCALECGQAVARIWVHSQRMCASRTPGRNLCAWISAVSLARLLQSSIGSDGYMLCVGVALTQPRSW